jgi:Uma2 family endonuclease
VGVPTIKTGPMTVEEFYAFTDTRPDNEKWELIDGEPILNASPSRVHQWIVKNLLIVFGNRERELKASWAILPGLGVRVSRTNRPEPDLLITPRPAFSADPLQRDTGEMIAAFEILSSSTMDRDLRWKRTAYTSLPHSRTTSLSRRTRWMSLGSRAIPVSQNGAIARSPRRSSCRRLAFRSRCRKSTATPG